MQSPAKFHRMHYNFVAKRIREVYEKSMEIEDMVANIAATETLNLLIFGFQASFAIDNPSFDPRRFEEACRPTKKES